MKNRKIDVKYYSAIRDLEVLDYYIKESMKCFNRNATENIKKHTAGIKIQIIVISILLNNKLDLDIANKINKALKGKKVGRTNLSDVIVFSCIKEKGKIEIKYQINSKYIKKKEYYDPNIAEIKLEEQETFYRTIITSALTTMISIYESFLGDILKYYASKDIGKYFDDEYKLKTADLLEYNDINELKHSLIDRFINDKLYDTSRILDYIAKKEGTSYDRLEHFDDIINEITLRRNLYIHNGGRANAIYLKKAKSSMYPINSVLKTDLNYIKESIIIIQKVITTLYLEAIRINIKNNKDVLTNLNNKSIKYLIKETANYKLAKSIYNQLYIIKDIDNESRYTYFINYLLALNALGEKEEFDREVKDLNPIVENSISSKAINIGIMCLKKDYKNVFNAIVLNKIFNKKDIEELPIFAGFRKSIYYKKYLTLNNDNEIVYNKRDCSDKIGEPKIEGNDI